jgi:hypothetical protein
MKCDKSKPMNVFGDTPARWYQVDEATGKGHHYDNHGRELVERDGALVLPDEPVAESAPPDLIVEPTAANAAEVLGKLHVIKLRQLFTERGGPAEIAVGEGAKARMIEWLVQSAR